MPSLSVRRLTTPVPVRATEAPGAGRRTALLLAAATSCADLLGLAAWRREIDAALAAIVLAGVAVAALRRVAGDRALPDPVQVARAETDGSILAALPEPVILVDARGTVVAANGAAVAVAPGLRAGHPLSIALRAPQLLGALPRVITTGDRAVVEYGGRVATEPTFEVVVSALPTRGEHGQAAALLSFRDLTAQRRSEAMHVDFVANVSHELRTPLASILGFVETLQGSARNDAGARERFLHIMHGQANRMTRLIDDLLQLSRVELKAHLPPTNLLDLGETVAHMAEIMAPLARERSVTVQLDLPAGPVMVVADRDEMLRLVENLLANAIKYGGSGGHVEVRVERADDGRTVELRVRDHGPGISPEHLPRLTERFYRVEVAESRAQGGTGLGLSIVKHIVTRHRGRLSIESEPGEGALFKVRLPAPPNVGDGDAAGT